MLEQLFDYIKDLKQYKQATFADRLNFYYSTYFFLYLALTTTFTGYVGDPLDCWTPEYYTSQWIQFVDNICWMKSTYYIPINVSVEAGREEELEFEIKYYQWIPIIFAALAVLFYIPNFFWNNIVHTTINLNSYVQVLTEGDAAIDCEERGIVANLMAKTLHHYFQNRIDFQPRKELKGFKYIKKKLAENPLFFWLFREDYGEFLAPCYLLIKVTYIGIALFTMFFLNQMVGPGFYTFGIDVASNFLAKSDWKSIASKNFPKVTLCDIEIRQIGQPKIQTVQCVLTINLFNEKIFTIVWFWMLFLLFSTTSSLLWWFYKVELIYVRANKILFYLKTAEDYQQYQEVKINDPVFQYFVREYLKADGAFILEIIEANSNAAFCSDLMMEMWHQYRHFVRCPPSYDNFDPGYNIRGEDFPDNIVNELGGEDDDTSGKKDKKKNLLCFSNGNKRRASLNDEEAFQPSVAQLRQQTLTELLNGAKQSNINQLTRRSPQTDQELTQRNPETNNNNNNNFNDTFMNIKPNGGVSKLKKRQNKTGQSLGKEPRERKVLLERFLDDCNADSTARLEQSGAANQSKETQGGLTAETET
ncbi:innexin unc-9-like isoform X2 [Convolutriloba macropyga]|uniref:innexin unc-9-like isoform X2 n=1 Tax=Convolutriloba macropyga TaxID=536237 RepID=UPI003F52417C